MIIQCPKCLAKFKLDDSKVKGEGTKVRCAKCKEVFVVTKEEKAPPPPPPQPEIPAEKEEFDFSSFGAQEEEKEEAPFGFGGGFEGEGVKKEEEKEDTGFSFGGFEEATPKGEEGTGAVPEWGAMSYGEVSLPGSGEAAPKAEEPSFGEFEFKETPGFEPAREELPVPAAPAPPVEEKAPIKEGLPETGAFAEERATEDFGHDLFPDETKEEKKGSPLKTALLLIAICAVIAVPLWYFWSKYTSAKTGEIALVDLNGEYAQNAEAGNIFVVTGRAVNNTDKARSFFQVKGTLFNKKGEKAAQSEVYCGNIFSKKEIETLPRGKIETDLKNKVGGSLSNINLAPGKSVPFMIVFFDLPAEMNEFSAEVTGSQVASE